MFLAQAREEYTQALRASHLSHGDLREPSICYEHPGNFYLQEGNDYV